MAGGGAASSIRERTAASLRLAFGLPSAGRHRSWYSRLRI